MSSVRFIREWMRAEKSIICYRVWFLYGTEMSLSIRNWNWRMSRNNNVNFQPSHIFELAASSARMAEKKRTEVTKRDVSICSRCVHRPTNHNQKLSKWQTLGVSLFPLRHATNECLIFYRKFIEANEKFHFQTIPLNKWPIRIVKRTHIRIQCSNTQKRLHFQRSVEKISNKSFLAEQ